MCLVDRGGGGDRAQIGLRLRDARAPHHVRVQGHGDGREDPDDRDHDHQFHQREPALTPPSHGVPPIVQDTRQNPPGATKSVGSVAT